jgi:hypothetical protein
MYKEKDSDGFAQWADYLLFHNYLIGDKIKCCSQILEFLFEGGDQLN